jgi:hypothetical protein
MPADSDLCAGVRAELPAAAPRPDQLAAAIPGDDRNRKGARRRAGPATDLKVISSCVSVKNKAPPTRRGFVIFGLQIADFRLQIDQQTIGYRVFHLQSAI